MKLAEAMELTDDQVRDLGDEMYEAAHREWLSVCRGKEANEKLWPKVAGALEAALEAVLTSAGQRRMPDEIQAQMAVLAERIEVASASHVPVTLDTCLTELEQQAALMAARHALAWALGLDQETPLAYVTENSRRMAMDPDEEQGTEKRMSPRT